MDDFTDAPRDIESPIVYPGNDPDQDLGKDLGKDSDDDGGACSGRHNAQCGVLLCCGLFLCGVIGTAIVFGVGIAT